MVLPSPETQQPPSTDVFVVQSAVHQLVLHPFVSQTLKVGSTTGTHSHPSACRPIRSLTFVFAVQLGGTSCTGLCSMPPASSRGVRSPPLVQPLAPAHAFAPLPDALRKGYTNETVARLTALKSTLGLSRKRASPTPPSAKVRGTREELTQTRGEQ